MEQHVGLIRAACLFLPMIVLIDLWLWRMPDRKTQAGALLAFLWTLPSVFALNIIAQGLGWWMFYADGGMFFGIPVDLYLGWCLLWGPIPLLAFPRLPLLVVLGIMLLVDIIFMPMLVPVLVLSEWWGIGEALAIVLCLAPAQLLGRLTRDGRWLLVRGALQVTCFIGLAGFLLPATICYATDGSIAGLLDMPLWQNALFLQLVAWPAVLGLSAVQEFVIVGKGTPFPFDPPKHLVKSGIYRYLRNPMQTSMVFVPVALGLWLSSYWVAGIGAMAIVYSIGFASWSEGGGLEKRFGDAWRDYRESSRNWLPHFLPSVTDEATIYYSSGCDVCSELAGKIAQLKPKGLRFVPAEQHPRRDLTRITYELPAAGIEGEGIAALARALEHVNFAWAILGGFMRLPLVRPMLQLIADSIGGGPRRVCRTTGAAPLRTN